MLMVGVKVIIMGVVMYKVVDMVIKKYSSFFERLSIYNQSY